MILVVSRRGLMYLHVAQAYGARNRDQSLLLRNKMDYQDFAKSTRTA